MMASTANPMIIGHSAEADKVEPEELAEALKIDVLDHTGKAFPLGGLVEGKRTVLIFTRHFCTPAAGAMWVP